jgi:catechol 2,3-dioxygenase-like lactoylglutathione lyase family enzyme
MNANDPTRSDGPAIVGIDHVQITVPQGQENAAREFYCGLLHLLEVEKPAALKPRGGFWLKAGDRQIHVGTEDHVNRPATKAHVAYAVNNLDAWREKLALAGIEIENGIPIPGYVRFEFRDPFGNRVEMIQVIS